MSFILIVAFQVVYGYVYFMAGILFTFFMAGLAIGSLYGPRIFKRTIKNYSINQVLLGILMFLAPILFVLFRQLSGLQFLVIVCFNLLGLLAGLLSGFQYAQASVLYKRSIAVTASSTYGLDLLGSATGALLTAIFLVPLFGIFNTCFIIGGLNIIASLIVWSNRKKLVFLSNNG
jgi:predicted membrane-bound spermidine synthase